MGGREDDELTAKGWLTLHPRSGITFSSIDDIIEDFYNFIEYLAIEGISDLCYRVADFIAMEEELGEYPNERGQIEGQDLHRNEGRDEIRYQHPPSTTPTHSHNTYKIQDYSANKRGEG